MNSEKKESYKSKKNTEKIDIDYLLIQNSNNNVYRDILKTITYRILGTSLTFTIGLLSTGSYSFATVLGFSDLILKPILYFVHERMWHILGKKKLASNGKK